MARIVQKKGTDIIKTSCEHMEGSETLCNYCPECGQEMQIEIPVTREICSHCNNLVFKIKVKHPEIEGAYITKEPFYCSRCGDKFDGKEGVRGL